MASPFITLTSPINESHALAPGETGAERSDTLGDTDKLSSAEGANKDKGLLELPSIGLQIDPPVGGGGRARAHTLRRDSFHAPEDAEVLENFRFGIFLRQFFYHLTFPMCLPLFLLIEGRARAINQHFLPSSAQKNNVFYLQVVAGLLPPFVLAFFLAYNNTDITNFEVGICLGGFATHKLMVATKYAVMNSDFYLRLGQSILPFDVKRRAELLSSWAIPTVATCDFELTQAAARTGINIDQVWFLVPEAHASKAARDEIARNVSSKLGEYFEAKHAHRERAHGEGGAKKRQSVVVFGETEKQSARKVCARALALQMVQEIVTKSSKARVNFRIAEVLSICQAFLPPLVRLCEGKNFFGAFTWHNVLLVLMIMVLCRQFIFPSAAFMMCGVADMYRRWAFLKVMGVMSDPDSMDIDILHEQEFTYRPEFIDLSFPENVSSWIAMREVMQDFGLEYRRRLEFYMSYTLLLGGAGLALLLYAAISRNYTEFGIFMLVSVSLNALIIFMLLMRLTSYGTWANRESKTHQQIMLRMQLAIRETFSNWRIGKKDELLRVLERDRLQNSEVLLDLCWKMLIFEDENNPVALLGLRANVTLVRGLASLVTAVTGAILRFLSFI